MLQSKSKSQKSLSKPDYFYNDFFQPYKDEKPTFTGSFAKSECGLYLIRHARNKKLLYVGQARDRQKGYNRTQGFLFRTAYRHFNSWDDPTQVRITFDRNAVEIAFIFAHWARVDALEAQFINEHRATLHNPKIPKPKEPPQRLRKRKVKLTKTYFSNDLRYSDATQK